MLPQDILIIQLRQLGDILLTTPCLRAIKNDNPKHRITMLTHRMGLAVLKNNPFLDELLSYDEEQIESQWKLLATLRRKKFTVAFDFMGNPRSAFYTLMSGAKHRLGFQSMRRLAYTQVLNRTPGPLYTVREKFRLLKLAGIEASDERLLMPWGDADLGPYNLLMTKPRFREAPLKVGLSPTHRKEVRRWPYDCYAQLADRLVKEKQAAVVWTWGPGEETIIDSILAMTKEETFKAPQTTLSELAALLSQLNLFVGNSNGASHFAVAADCPSLQIHGPSQAEDWCPMTDKHRAVQCNGELSGLSVDTVWEALEAAIVFEKKNLWRGPFLKKSSPPRLPPKNFRY
ncbi:MAG: glycosyltransferase family 9 protein [Deltaproteobacteria bacterium]|nr:glycosyltransferase family 9 protein [Deltaproteobacteria bacterium]